MAAIQNTPATAIEEVEAPSDYTFPLTLAVMDDPVMTKYGQSFERSAILQWLKAGHGACPLSRRPLSLADIVTNHSLRLKIVEWKKEMGEEVTIVVNAANRELVYGFITIPTKEMDSTEGTLNSEDEDDLLAFVTSAMRQNEEAESRRHRRRQRRQAQNKFKPFQGLRNLIAGSR